MKFRVVWLNFGNIMNVERKAAAKPMWRPVLIVLLGMIVLIKLISLKPVWIEHYYSRGLYIYIAEFLRILFGWVPFSLGDVLYAAAFIYLLASLVKLIRAVYLKRVNKKRLKFYLGRSAVIFAVIYIVFNIYWGLNYNRLGIGHQLKLPVAKHSKKDLENITSLLVQKLNQTRKAIGKVKYPSYSKMFTGAITAYKKAANHYPFLRYESTSIKGSLYGKGGNYLGFLGYYNPFTGESQLNLTQQPFTIPFVICHEMSHQLGYASESQANFVGYLTAIHSPDTLFHYSAYFDLFSYANHELAVKDSVQARENFKKLDTLVKKDFYELKLFQEKYKNPFEKIVRIFYDRYLKANQQAKGVKSYNQVTDLLVAYYKKYGTI
jgi:hypothetical protein